MYFSVVFHGDDDGGELQRFATIEEAKAYVGSLRAGDVDEGDVVEVVAVAGDGREETVFERDMAGKAK